MASKLIRASRLLLRATPYALNGFQATAEEAKGRLSALARLELELARAEAAVKARGLARAAAFGLLAVVALVFGLGAAIAGAVLGVATVLPGWAAALTVAGGLILFAAALALAALRSAKSTGPPIPSRTIGQLRDTIQSVRGESS